VKDVNKIAGAYIVVMLVVVLVLVLVGDRLGHFGCDSGSEIEVPDWRALERDWHEYRTAVDESKKAIGQPGGIYRGEAILRAAVRNAYDAEILPIEGSLPTEGERLLLSLHRLSPPPDDAGAELVQLIQSKYPQYRPEAYDWYVRRLIPDLPNSEYEMHQWDRGRPLMAPPGPTPSTTRPRDI
jgi:hypothetical protein